MMNAHVVAYFQDWYDSIVPLAVVATLQGKLGVAQNLRRGLEWRRSVLIAEAAK
jgi:hypothetical protein